MRTRTRLISDAEVAEVPYTAFASKKGQAITARLIVRRVTRPEPQAAAGQDELFPVWRYHAVFTDSPFEMIQAEGAAPRPRHRRAGLRRPDRRAPGSPAIRAFRGERRVADLRRHLRTTCSAPPARWPSPAHARARGATIRRDLIAVAARIARHGRGHITLHLPEGWHREHEWMNLFEAACGPPAAAA